tara:strand:+ start:16731 stop:16856 length:126 start_codon:yes stop_codon:yes gene_type:complete
MTHRNPFAHKQNPHGEAMLFNSLPALEPPVPARKSGAAAHT